jgi:maltose O-acetyltransferase
MHLPSVKNSYKDFSTRLRYFFAKGFLDHCGKCVNIQPKAIIASRVSIGDYSGIGSHSLIQGGVRIGDHVMMGPEVFIYTQNHQFDRTDITMDQQGFAEEKPVVIRNDVWIGSRATILPGVEIGEGCIIGASSVVTKSLPPYSVAAGNPAIVKKYRKNTK